MANITKSVVEDAALGWLEGMFASIEQAMFGESLYPSREEKLAFLVSNPRAGVTATWRKPRERRQPCATYSSPLITSNSSPSRT